MLHIVLLQNGRNAHANWTSEKRLFGHHIFTHPSFSLSLHALLLKSPVALTVAIYKSTSKHTKQNKEIQ